MSYKPDYDKLTKDYNDALNVLSGGKYTPLRRKSDVTQTSTFDKSLNSGYNNSVGANHDSPVYGNAQATKTYRPSYGNAQTMPSFEKGWGTTERGGRIPLDPTYGGIQNAKTYKPSYEYTPSYGNKTNGTMRASSPTTSVWSKDFETPAPTAPQTPAYRPGEGFITRPENAILRADERENIKPTQLPYKSDEHGGEYVQYNNQTTGFGELKLASNDVGVKASNVRWDYYDMHLPEAEQELLEVYLNEYERTPDNAIITLPEGIEVNKKLYINEQIMAIRRNLIPSQMLLFAQKDFEMLDIDERNYKIVLECDDSTTYDQALYEYAIDLYNSYQENGAYPYSTRNYDGSLNEYGKWVYKFAGKVSKLSGKEKASDIPSWAKGKQAQPGEDSKSFARRLLDEKYGKGNWESIPKRMREYSQIKKNAVRGKNIK